MKILIGLLISLNLFAADGAFEVPKFNVEIKAPNVMDKMQAAINNPEGVLNRYTPVGGTIKNKVVHNNEVSFVMTKKVLIITKTFKVHFTVDMHEEINICPANQLGYKYKVELDGSDDLVTDNVDRLEFNICITKKDENSAIATVGGYIYKGSNYSEPVGSIAKNTIQDQVDPFVKAIKDEVINSLY